MNAKLIMFKANGQRKDFSLANPVTVIGRGKDCDLRVPLVSVSRKHCELRLAGETLKVKDLASSNGTYVNNKRISEEDLAAGDRLVVGPIVFTIQIDGVPEEIKPVKTYGQKMAEAGETGEEIVELEADVAAGSGAEAGETVGADLSQALDDEEEGDPIAALEALAAEAKEDRDTDDEEEEQKQ